MPVLNEMFDTLKGLVLAESGGKDGLMLMPLVLSDGTVLVGVTPAGSLWVFRGKGGKSGWSTLVGNFEALWKRHFQKKANRPSSGVRPSNATDAQAAYMIYGDRFKDDYMTQMRREVMRSSDVSVDPKSNPAAVVVAVHRLSQKQHKLPL